MIEKKGQNAGGAAGLIAVIALLIVLYILFLPMDIREDLINGTTTTSSSTSKTKLEETQLVFEHPGTLDPLKNRDREKILTSFNLYSDKTSVELESVEAVHIENGWFTTKTYNLSFVVDDLENTKDYVLALDSINSHGRLMITLNGKMIYDAETKPGNVDPITLKKEDIKEQNSLIFSVSGVGTSFWKLNEYDLKNLRVIADFIDVSKKEYNNFFILTATEKENLESSTLSFNPDCLTQKVGPMRVWINDKELHYASIPDCGMLSKIDFDPAYLMQGENRIVFRVEEGNYFVDNVKVKLTLKETGYPISYFELSSKDIQKINNKTANVTLQLKFADKENKIGELNVNGHLSRLEISNATYSKNINIYVQEDQNYLQIVPKTTLNIVDLKVVLLK